MAQSTPSSYLYGLALRLMLNASVGVSPWDVLHTGLTHHLPVTIGQMTVGVAMLIVVINQFLLQQPIGPATVLNAILIGVFVDLFSFLPHPSDLLTRWPP